MAQSKYKISEGRFKGFDGASLFFQVWEKPEASGTLIITHGHGEHSGCYHRVADALKDENWTIYAWDMRGHGHSEGSRGFAPSLDAYCDDYALFLKMILENPKVKKGPVVLLCHSMGGLVQFKTLIKHPEFKPDAVVASSPLFGIGVHVPGFKKVGAQWLNKFVPTLTLWNEITNEHVTRDPEIIRELEKDPYRHARISAGVYLGFLDSFPFVHDGASKLKFKTLFQISDKDPVISSAEAIRFFESMGSTEKEIKIYPDAKHEVYNDIVRDQVYQDLRNFLAGVKKQ